MKAHFILYVTDQERSAAFYSSVLGAAPSLNVPGMTEFLLGDLTVLGLMPEEGIVRLLGEAVPDPSLAHGVALIRTDMCWPSHRRLTLPHKAKIPSKFLFS